MTIRKRLKLFMQEKAMSQECLAQMLGTNKFTLSRWMNGHSVPSPAYVQVINAVIK